MEEMVESRINGEIQENVVRPSLLVADDSATVRKVVELTFVDEGIEVTAVADAASAMEKFVQTQPDLVMVDVSLPGTSGYQICEMIKQDEATAHIPVLLLVGSFEPFDHDEAERVGADGFLLKPFKSIRELVTRVKDLVEPPRLEENHVPEGRKGQEGETGLRTASEITGQTSETTDIENLYQKSFADTAEIEEFDTVDDLFSDLAMDDQLINASYHSSSSDESALPAVDSSGKAEQSKEFDWSPASIVEPASTSNLPVIGDGPSSFANGSQGVGDQQGVERSHLIERYAEPSDEFIALVAQRVVERLSDRAIRDIAKEVVPRITEKLIREALAEEKKSE